MMKILIVEDKNAISDFICVGPRSKGYLCEQAFDRLIACGKIDENPCDLILLDVMMANPVHCDTRNGCIPPVFY